jgi:hypothetical protein
LKHLTTTLEILGNIFFIKNDLEEAKSCLERACPLMELLPTSLMDSLAQHTNTGGNTGTSAGNSLTGVIYDRVGANDDNKQSQVHNYAADCFAVLRKVYLKLYGHEDQATSSPPASAGSVEFAADALSSSPSSSGASSTSSNSESTVNKSKKKTTKKSRHKKRKTFHDDFDDDLEESNKEEEELIDDENDEFEVSETVSQHQFFDSTVTGVGKEDSNNNNNSEEDVYDDFDIDHQPKKSKKSKQKHHKHTKQRTSKDNAKVKSHFVDDYEDDEFESFPASEEIDEFDVDSKIEDLRKPFQHLRSEFLSDQDDDDDIAKNSSPGNGGEDHALSEKNELLYTQSSTNPTLPTMATTSRSTSTAETSTATLSASSGSTPSSNIPNQASEKAYSKLKEVFHNNLNGYSRRHNLCDPSDPDCEFEFDSPNVGHHPFLGSVGGSATSLIAADMEFMLRKFVKQDDNGRRELFKLALKYYEDLDINFPNVSEIYST